MTTVTEPTCPPPAPGPQSGDRYRAAALLTMLRLHWFINLRWCIVVVALAVLLAEQWLIPTVVRPAGLVATLLVLAGANAVWVVFSRYLSARAGAGGEESRTVRVALIFANLQVAIDLLALTLVLRYTGGVETPMSIFYLFHMAIGSLLLRSWQALLQGAWAVLLYSCLCVGELVGWLTPHYLFLPAVGSLDLHTRAEYVAAAIFVFACGVFGTLFVTQRIAARLDERERQLREAHRALQQSQVAIFDLQRRKSRFLQTSAHQLKSPLAGIQTLTALIRDGIIPEQTVHETCEKIIRRCRDGISQVTEMLTLARVEETDPNKHRNALSNVCDVVRKLCQQYRPQAEGKRIELLYNCQIPQELDLRAHVDPLDLADCVGNLIDNAIKYTPEGGTVTVAATRANRLPQKARPGIIAPAGNTGRQGGDYVLVMVKDTGMGIEKSSLSSEDGHGGSIFDAFRRGKGALSARIPGTGLGLSIVREVVERAGGRIKVHSRPGKGSTFTLMFSADRALPEGPAVVNTRASEIVIDPPGNESH